jgi:hypothetical protein
MKFSCRQTDISKIELNNLSEPKSVVNLKIIVSTLISMFCIVKRYQNGIDLAKKIKRINSETVFGRNSLFILRFGYVQGII